MSLQPTEDSSMTLLRSLLCESDPLNNVFIAHVTSAVTEQSQLVRKASVSADWLRVTHEKLHVHPRATARWARVAESRNWNESSVGYEVLAFAAAFAEAKPNAMVLCSVGEWEDRSAFHTKCVYWRMVLIDAYRYTNQPVLFVCPPKKREFSSMSSFQR